MLYLQQIVFSRIGDGAQVVEFGIDPCRNHSAAVQQGGRVVIDFLLDPVANQRTGIQLFADPAKARFIARHASLLDRLDSTEGHFQLYHLAGRYAADSHFGDNTFQVSYLFQLLFQQFFYLGMPEEVFHHILPFMDRLDILQREKYPTAQHTRTHRRNSLI